MEDDVKVISIDDDNNEDNSSNKTKVSDFKKDIEAEKLACQSRMDHLRSRLFGLRKRPPDAADESSHKSHVAKKGKQTKSDNATKTTDVEVVCLDAEDNKKSKLQALPSFKLMSEVSFDSVIKIYKPTLLETQMAESEETRQPAVEATDGSTEATSTHPPPVQSRDPTPTGAPGLGRRHHPLESRTDRLEKPQVIKEEAKRSHDMPKPLVQVVFRDEQVARMFGKSVHEALLEVLAVKDPQVDNSKKPPGLVLNIWESELPDEQEEFQEAGGLFKFDTAPVTTPLRRNLPRYRAMCTSALEDKSAPEAEAENEGAGSLIRNTCFNCEGSHMLSECPKPINDGTVAKNRMKLMGPRRLQPRASRYHVDEEQRFAHLVPGTVSAKLRSAMGLNQQQLPGFIYKMRIYGYPPGWLEEARITHSGLQLFNENPDIAKNGTEEKSGSKDTYDLSKIIDFPGFNVVSESTVEEHAKHRCPPPDWRHSKEAMVQQIGSSAAQAYRKKKLKKNDSADGNTADFTADMDVVEIDDEVMIVLDSTAETDVIELNQEEPSSVSTAADPGDSQDSLCALEAQKKQILVELEKSSSSPPAPPGCSQPASPCVEPSSSPSNQVASVPATPEARGRSMGLAMGTPILESASPFSTVPCADSFSQGISDHINFENLPDSTGKYETMRTILNRVKQLVEHHEDL